MEDIMAKLSKKELEEKLNKLKKKNKLLTEEMNQLVEKNNQLQQITAMEENNEELKKAYEELKKAHEEIQYLKDHIGTLTKSTINKGGRKPSITPEQEEIIMKLRKNNVSYNKIAKELNVAVGSVYNIVKKYSE
jgi:DNA repair exonuclease SbcCD ATPase subunit